MTGYITRYVTNSNRYHFCLLQSYSYGGTTAAGHNAEGIENLKPNRERVLRIRFNADTSSNLTWNFKPQQAEIKVG